MFKKILAATDLSETSERALAIAVGLAREHHAALRVVHVIPDLTTGPWTVEAYGVDLAALMEEGRTKGQEALARRIDRISQPPVDLQACVLIGKAASEIKRYAAAQSVDLIVLGSHGRGPVGRMFLGSVAHRVLHEASCPVLVVRPTATAAIVSDAA